MTMFTRKLAVCTCALALLSFSAAVTAEAGFGLKLPKINLPGISNTNDPANTTNAPIKQNGGNIQGQVFYNSSNNDLPAAGFDVYLIHGYTNSHDLYKIQGDALVIYSHYVKLGVTDAQGRYSAPIPPNINDFASKSQFPEVRLLFYKPNFTFRFEKRMVACLSDFTETKNIDYENQGAKTTHIVFEAMK